MTDEARPQPRLQRLERNPAHAAARLADAERHAKRVSRLKIVLPVFALLALGAIFLSLVVNQREDEHFVTGEAPGIEMHAPVLKGIGDNGKPYQVVASEAAQTRDGHVELTALDADVELEDGTMHLTAEAGSLHPETGETKVTGGVVIDLGDIYHFETERAEGNMKTGIFSGDAPVRVTGPMGTIDAAGFRIEKSVKRVTFTGGVTSVIEPAATTTPDTPAAPAPETAP